MYNETCYLQCVCTDNNEYIFYVQFVKDTRLSKKVQKYYENIIAVMQFLVQFNTRYVITIWDHNRIIELSTTEVFIQCTYLDSE